PCAPHLDRRQTRAARAGYDATHNAFIPSPAPSTLQKENPMRRPVLSPLLIALSLAMGACMTANAAVPAPTIAPVQGTLLNVSSNAEARRVPDVATISAGVVTQAADGNTAMRQNAQQMDKVL